MGVLHGIRIYGRPCVAARARARPGPSQGTASWHRHELTADAASVTRGDVMCPAGLDVSSAGFGHATPVSIAASFRTTMRRLTASHILRVRDSSSRATTGLLPGASVH